MVCYKGRNRLKNILINLITVMMINNDPVTRAHDRAPYFDFAGTFTKQQTKRQK